MHSSALNDGLRFLHAEAAAIDPDTAETPTMDPQHDEVIAGPAPFEARQLWILLQRKVTLVATIEATLEGDDDDPAELEELIGNATPDASALLGRQIQTMEEIQLLSAMLTLTLRLAFPEKALYPFSAVRSGWRVIFTDADCETSEPEENGPEQPGEITISVNTIGGDGASLPCTLPTDVPRRHVRRI